MRRHGAIAVVLAGLIGLSASAPDAARASAYTQILHVYQTSGTVPACRFSSPQLLAALRGVDTYGQQYFADFSDAIQNALATRAAGACTPGHHTNLSPASAPQAPLPPSPTAATEATLPPTLLALVGLSLLIALIAAAAAAARAGGRELGWAPSWRHAWAEAGYRLGGRLADLADRWRR